MAANLEHQVLPETGTDLQLFFEFAVKGLGRILTIDFLADKYLNSTQHFFLPSERKRYLIMIWWDYDRFQRFYITRNLASFGRHFTETRIGALYMPNPRRSLPADFFTIPGFQTLGNSGAILAGNMHKKLASFNGVRLLTGFKGAILGNYYFVGSSVDLSIRQELRKLLERFAAFAALIMGISLIIGGFLSLRLLRPIGNLARGLTLIGEKQFHTVIPIHEMDEVGKLSATFNRMMEGFADLELARIVQETLFPQAPLRMGKWEISGFCRSASEVGGDYFDYFPIDDQRIAVFIGDVSGHGVSAALVVAMAKALMFHPATGRNPVQVLEGLHQVFLSVLKRKKMMTCFFIVLDTKTGQVTGSNAGHLFPFIVSKGGTTYWEIMGFPLGARKIINLVQGDFFLSDENVLILYTDGLVEAPGRNGDEVGYTVFEQELASLLKATAGETAKNIFQWHDTLAMPGNPLDDKTLVVIQAKR